VIEAGFLSYPNATITVMDANPVYNAITALEKPNANLDPDLLGVEGARDLLATYARAEKLAGFGKTVLARRLADATEVATGDRDLDRKG
jgi:hypothetical protein